MTKILVAMLAYVSLTACATTEPQTPEEAAAQKCRLERADCEMRIRRCQETGEELACRDADSFCKGVTERCPGM